MRLKVAIVTNQRHRFDGNPVTLWLFLALTGHIVQFVFKLVLLDLDSAVLLDLDSV